MNTSKNKPLKNVGLSLKAVTVEAYCKVAIKVDAEAEVDEIEKSTWATSYQYYREDLSKDYYGGIVQIKLYLKVSSAVGSAHSEIERGFASTKTEVSYLL